MSGAGVPAGASMLGLPVPHCMTTPVLTECVPCVIFFVLAMSWCL